MQGSVPSDLRGAWQKKMRGEVAFSSASATIFGGRSRSPAAKAAAAQEWRQPCMKITRNNDPAMIPESVHLATRQTAPVAAPPAM
jgi:hypothetical protein